MECGGVVAFVQGLKDAGLAVTLMKSTHLQNALTSKVAVKCSVDTGTDPSRAAPQIQDGHYTTTYKATHCSIRSSSPPERLTEFPPQRPESCRNQGNFQACGYGAEDNYITPLHSYGGSQPYRAGMVWPDRGSAQFRCVSPPVPPQADPFVHSLRRYPSPSPARLTSPQRSLSGELVQRLLSYTQNKHMEGSKNSSVKTSFESPVREQNTSTKNIQTYTRAKRSRDYGANTGNDIRSAEQYDYLKTSRRCGRHPEVRYLNDVKRCIRDTIKQICEDRPLVCPQIRSRYSQHKKEHHRNSSEGQTLQTCPSHPELCCYCKKPIPCSCKPGTSNQPTPTSNVLPAIVRPNSDKGICTCQSYDSSENKIEKEIFSWIKDIPVYADDSPENKNKREEMVKDLAEKLKKLEGDENYKSRAKEDIRGCIEKLPMWYPGGKRDRELFKNQITDQLLSRFVSISDKNEEFNDIIAKWLENIQFEDDDIDKKIIGENFVTRLKPFYKLNKFDDMKAEIEDILQELPIANKNKVVSELAKQLNRNLTDVSARQINTASGLPKQINRASLDTELEKKISDWLEEAHELQNDTKENKSMVKILVETLKKTQEQDLNDDETNEKINEEVNDWIEMILMRNGKKLDSRKKKELSQRLLDKFTSQAIKSNGNKSSLNDELEDGNLNNSILSEISGLIEDISSNISNSARKEIKNKVANILTRNYNQLSYKNDNISHEIVNILQNYAEIAEDEAVAVTSALISRVKGMFPPDQLRYPLPQRSPNAENMIKQYILEEIDDIFNDYNISPNVTKVAEQELLDALADQIVRGTSNEKTKDNIVSILYNANLPDEVVHEISSRLLQRNKEILLSYKTQDSKIVMTEDKLNKGKSISQFGKSDFEDKAEKEVLGFIEYLTGGASPKTKEKQKLATGELVHKLGDIVSGPDEADKEKSIIKEVSQYLRKLSLDLDISKVEAQKLANRLQTIGFQASTPKKGVYSFYPRRGMTDISGINIDNNDHDDNASPRFRGPQFERDDENEYVNKLKYLIQSWMDELLTEFSVTEDKSFKNTMIHDLVGDIIDRQKYLQLNPEAKTSDQEEVEHLKYQVFRWLNKLPEADYMSSAMQRTEDLMNKIRDIILPNRVKTNGKDSESETAQGLIPNPKDSIKDEISLWIEEIPKNLFSPSDKNFQMQMISELADKIQKLRVNNQIDSIDSEITNWLSKLIKDANKRELIKMAEALKARLKDRGFTEASFMLSQDSSQFVEENLIEAIQDWLKKLPRYQTRNSTQRRQEESLIFELVNGLKSVFESAQTSNIVDRDKMLVDEIMKQLDKFTMDIDQKSEKNELIQKISEQLLHYIKGLQLFQNISERQDKPLDHYLTSNLEDWFSSLPIPKMNSDEALTFKNLKKEFTEKIKEMRQDYPKNEVKLKDEIRSYLNRFPIEEDLKYNQEFLNDKVQNLFNTLLWVPIENERKYTSDIFVKNAVYSWMKSLPLNKGKTLNDIPTDAVDKLTSAASELLVKTNLIRISEISKILEDETVNFLKKVPLDPSIHYETKSLSQSLFKQIKEMSREHSTQPTVSVTKPPPIKKAADVLFDDIEKWCNNLPIQEGTPEKAEQSKKEIATKVIHKVGELNMNPEVFNDDFLYGDLLDDNIENLLTNLSNEYIKNNLATIKDDLITKVKEARQKIQEETAGQAYKQQLREAISRTMPSQYLTVEERASFEELKDNLADAFINLHYIGEDDKLRNMYKTKIHDKVSNFCNDYLKKHPATPIDRKQLNQDLYNALKSVPIPKEEIVRKEVELSKLKEEVNEWVKELPLEEQLPTEKIHTNKIVAVLSKKIHDIEKEKELYPDADTDFKLQSEITKWVKKLPLNINDKEALKLTDKLVNNLKNSEKSRKVSASTRHSIEPGVFDFNPPLTELTKTCQPSCSGPCKSYILPPSGLTFGDREHLQRIKERATASKMRYPLSKDASVSPLPVDVESQTEIEPCETPIPCSGRLSWQNSVVHTQKPPQQKAMKAVGSQAEVSPHVIVKEYYWDPTGASNIQGLCGTCPSKLPTAPCQPSLTERPVSLQPSPFNSPCSEFSHVPITPSPRASLGSQTPRRPRKEWEQPRQSRETPGASSEDQADPGTSFRPKEKVTRLGSFDNTEPNHSKSKEWKFAEDDFWGDKRRFLSDDDNEAVLKERRKEEEKVRCRCRERILTKCNGRKRGRGCHTSCQSNDDVNRCSKCCGIHCPYPSYLYFRQ